MTREQINQLNMYEGTEQILITNNAIWGSNPVVSAVVTTLTSFINAINATNLVQKTSSIGTTITKQTAKLDMATATIEVANAGKAYAKAIANPVLYDEMNITQSDIIRTADIDAEAICQAVHDNILPFITSTGAYGANSTSLANLQSLITTYNLLMGTTVAKKVTVVTATLTLLQNFNGANGLLKTQLDPLMVQYKTSNPVFYNQYTAAREISDIGHRHTVILTGFVYNSSNVALANATVILSGGATHTKITLATGKYKFTRLHTGTYTLTITATGYTAQTHNFTITTNGTTHTDFVMVTDGGVGTGIGVGTV